MKKLLLLLALLFLSMPAYATCWYEYSPKAYIDLDSLQKRGNIAIVWVKLLNDGNIKPIDNKKIWFTQNSMYIDLKNKKTAIKDAYFYDLNRNQVQGYTLEQLQWDVIVPDSMGDLLYEVVEKYPRINTFTSEHEWYKIEENIQIDINSLMMTNSECCNMWLRMPAENIANLKSKTKYVEAFLSVNLAKRQATVIELKQYNKNKQLLKQTKFQYLNYVEVAETNAINKAIDFIFKLSEMLDKPSNPPLK